LVYFVWNKGFIILDELLRASSEDSSNKIKLIISNFNSSSEKYFIRWISWIRGRYDDRPLVDFVWNKGFIILDELLRASSEDSSNKIKLIISNFNSSSEKYFIRWISWIRGRYDTILSCCSSSTWPKLSKSPSLKPVA